MLARCTIGRRVLWPINRARLHKDAAKIRHFADRIDRGEFHKK